MLNLYKYYFKKRLIPMGIIAGILSIIFAVYVFTNDFAFHNENTIRYTTPFGIISVLFIILCTGIPFFELVFKTNKKGIDLFYSFPIKRYKLFLVKYLIGLTEAIISFIISYIIMILAMLTKENGINPVYYLLYFLTVLACGIMIYTISAFAFTRGNTVWDSIIITAFIMCFGAAITAFIARVSSYPTNPSSIDSSYFFAYSQVTVLTNLLASNAVGANAIMPNLATFITMNVITVIAAIAAFVGYLFFNQKDKAESATELSESIFGYKVMLPYYTILLMGICADIYYIIIIAIASFIGYIIYNRGFKFKLDKLIPMLSSIGVGAILSIILTACNR